MIRSLAAALCALWLAGCYQSDKLLLDARQAAAPLAVGTQTIADEGERPESVEISLGPDGWYRVKDRGGAAPDRVLFTRLAGVPDGYFAFALESRGSYTYGVAEKREGRLYLDLPFCDLGVTRDIALAHGVKMSAKGAMAPVCTFDKAADLQAALADYAVRRGDHGKLPNLPAQ